jgi:hypothetical protein
MPRHVPTFSTEVQKEILERHINLGPQKAVSYLPKRTIKKVLNMSIQEYVSMVEKGGNKAIVLRQKECCISSGAVYAYSCEHLAAILNQYHEILIAYGWPTTSSDFIKKMASEWLDSDCDLYQVIERAFGDPFGRTTQGRKSDLSRV